jgi:hypothetical protein
VQVYGRDSQETEPKGLWRAYGIEKMLKANSAFLKIAYIDTIEKEQYSVLLSSSTEADERAQVISELYRQAILSTWIMLSPIPYRPSAFPKEEIFKN